MRGYTRSACTDGNGPRFRTRRGEPTCDTLHAHTQVLGKLAAALAPPEPQLQHAALRLTARGWETLPLPAPDGSGAFVVALDLRRHEAVVEHSDGRDRARRAHARSAGRRGDARRAGGGRASSPAPVAIDPTPQETPWTTPLDEDEEHATLRPAQVRRYFAAATRAAQVLAAFRAPYRGRSTPVNAWWGSFDLAVSLFSGRPAEPPSDDFIMRNAMDAEEIAVGWWPGDARYPQGGLLRLRASRAGRASRTRRSRRPPRTGTPTLGEFILDWDDVRAGADPHAAALEFARSACPARVRGLRLGRAAAPRVPKGCRHPVR